MKSSVGSPRTATTLLILTRTIVGLAIMTLTGNAQLIYEPYTFTTIAGKPESAGTKDGTNNSALFNYPYELALDSTGDIYVSDAANSTIRKMTRVGTNWVVTTIAGKAGISGSMDGTNSTARFNGPTGLALDSDGSLYVSDYYNHTLRKVTPMGTNWVVTTIAGKAGMVGGTDGMNSAARFNGPCNVVLDKHGNLYMGDDLDKTIRKVTQVGTNWMVTTIAGRSGREGSIDGTNSAARFTWPSGLALDNLGNLYVAEEIGSVIRKITPVGTNWVVTTIAGKAGINGFVDGPGSSARFNGPVKLVLDSVGNIFVSDDFNNTIRKLAPVGTNWMVTTLAGTPGLAGSADGTGSRARFNFNHGLAVDDEGNLYVADCRSNTIRKGRPALMISALRFNSGEFGFELRGQSGKVVIIEVSTDLERWLPLWTNTPGGPLNFRDVGSGVHPGRFYRAFAK